MKAKYFLDTEFNEKPGSLDLISIGIVHQNGSEYYAISSEFNENDCNDWVKENVLPHLIGQERKSKSQIKNEIIQFIGYSEPEFWGYYSDYDWVLFCWLFGAMIDLPENFPMFCLDLKQVIYINNIDKNNLPKQLKNEHHALADAKWNKDLYSHLQKLKAL